MTAIGSPLYDLADGHIGALLAVLALPLLGWVVATTTARLDPETSRLARMVDGYRRAPVARQAIVWLLLASAAVHAGLAADPGHAGSGLRGAFLIQAGLCAVAAARLTLGRSWRGLALVALLGSIVAYWAAVLGGEAPDQLGIATKLAEILAVALIVRSTGTVPGRGRIRAALGGLATATLIIALVVLTDVAAWAGAAQAAGGADALAGAASHDIGGHANDGGEADGHGHSHGGAGVPAPGMLMAIPPDTTPTDAQRAAAAELHAAVTVGIARFADPAVAAAAGYHVGAITGRDHHAGNEAFEHDGRTLDPKRPETLVYAEGPTGPVLLGAMFLMERIGEPGPTIGGPLTIWHGHEQICVSIVPPSITGILSPLGGCPVGSFLVPLTAEMIHVWTVPGVEQPFGDIDPVWLDAYLAGAAE